MEARPQAEAEIGAGRVGDADLALGQPRDQVSHRAAQARLVELEHRPLIDEVDRLVARAFGIGVVWVVEPVEMQAAARPVGDDRLALADRDRRARQAPVILQPDEDVGGGEQPAHRRLLGDRVVGIRLAAILTPERGQRRRPVQDGGELDGARALDLDPHRLQHRAAAIGIGREDDALVPLHLQDVADNLLRHGVPVEPMRRLEPLPRAGERVGQPHR